MENQDHLLGQIQTQLARIQRTAAALPPGTDVGDAGDALRRITETVQGMVLPQNELRVQEPPSPVIPAQRILDEITPQSALARLEEDRQEQIVRDREARDARIEEQRGLVERASDFVLGRRPIEEKVRAEQETFRVRETLEKERAALSQSFELQQKAIELSTQRDAAVAALGNQAIATPFITGQQARISENYDRRIASIAALSGAQTAYARALQGNVSLARTLIGDIVDAYTYDTQLELSRVEMFMNINKDEIGMLDRDYQNAIRESQEYWQAQLAEQKTEREAVLNLMLQHTGAGINPTDTIESAVRKSAVWTGIQPDADVRELMARFPRANIAEQDTFTEAVNKISKLETLDMGMAAPDRPHIFGTEGAGYFQQFFNPQTGNWEVRQITTPEPNIADDDGARIDLIGNFIVSKMGGDGFISAETYVEAQRGWIGLGGSVADFRAAFPPETVMGSWELPNLPSSIWKGETRTITNESLVE